MPPLPAEPLPLLAQAAAPDIAGLVTLAINIAFFLVIVGLGVFIAIRLKRGIEEQREKEAIEERAFEKTLLQEFSNSRPSPYAQPTLEQDLAGVPLAQAPPMEQPEAPRPAPMTAVSIGQPPPPSPATASTPLPPPPSGVLRPIDAPPANLDELVERLRNLGVITSPEGRVAMPIPPDAPIFRLKAGGLCLLLPRLESEAFLAHQAKRFDLVFVLTANGTVLTLARMQRELERLVQLPTK
ncbi:MAG: hypothetical protein RLY93_13370 [Sumerlaeia bacterium]